jgi:DNA-binding beta-propeller fold protein YncE
MLTLARARLLLLACCTLLPLCASAWDRGRVERFATMPGDAPHPEGITADKHGDLYVTPFDPTGKSAGRVVVFGSRGDLKRVLTISGASGALLGLAFQPDTEDQVLLVLDLGQSRVWSVNPLTGAATVFAQAPAGSGLNALTFDGAGNVYISDSFGGIIWKTGPRGGAPVAWVTDPLLKTTGTPGFGANGLDFNRSETALFVANTGDDTVIRIPVTAGQPGKAKVFVHSINGADGLFVDEHDNVWVCANQADEIVVVDKTGRAIAKLGDFNGLRDGAPAGFLFPASLVRKGEWIYVTNLSLDIRNAGASGPAVDSPWAAEVTTHTISRIRARIPR